MIDLQETVITEQLALRAPRLPDHVAENRGLRRLAEELANPKGNVLGLLCDLALELCHAQSAGVSLLQFDGTSKSFHWHAISGAWSRFAGGGLPRDASPCGVVIDRNATLLMRRPGKVFPLVAAVEPELVEGLLAPFQILGEPVGTVWVLSHDENHKFNSEDVRVVESLATFAAAAFLVRDTLDRTLLLNEELIRARATYARTLERISQSGTYAAPPKP